MRSFLVDRLCGCRRKGQGLWRLAILGCVSIIAACQSAPKDYAEFHAPQSPVNVASRIAGYARPGEVLVSRDVVDQGVPDGARFTEIGPVELKGLVEPVQLFVAYPDAKHREAAFRLATDARRAGHGARVAFGRSLKGQLKDADRAGARYVAILGDEGTALKDMETGEQRDVETDTVMHHIRGGL